MCRNRQRRLSASDSSRVLFDVRNTSGIWRGVDRAELGDRHLVLGEDLEQQRLGLDLDPVDLVDQQHDRLVGADGLEQRAGEQEVLGEDVVLDRLPGAVVVCARPGCAAAASCSSTRRAPWTRRGPRSTAGGSAGRRCISATDLASWVLPVPAGPSTRTGLPQPVGQVDDAGDALVGQVVDLGQPVAHRRRRTRSAGARASGRPVRRPALGRLGRVADAGHGRTCPSPADDVLHASSARAGPSGPRACSFWVEMPISAPKPELLAVDEPGRGVDQHGGGVDLGGEPVGRGQVGGHDRLGVARAVPGDVVDGLVERRRPPRTASFRSRNSVA